VLNWSRKNGLIPDEVPWSDPVSGMRLTETKSNRQPWEPEELKLLFASPVYVREERPIGGKGEAAFWLPLLALFTGARLNGPLWAKLTDPAFWQKPDFPYPLLTDLIDRSGGGLSFWEVKTAVDPALKRIAAALLAGTDKAPGKEIRSLEFRLVNKAKVAALGIKITTSPGDTKDTAINNLHVELDDLTASKAVALLRLMNKKARVFSANESARCVTESLVRKHLHVDVLKKDFLYALHQKAAVRIVISP
jgi:hypothetical protein